jgi:hypothetical protein
MIVWALKCLFLALGIPLVIALKRWLEGTNKHTEHPLADSKN